MSALDANETAVHGGRCLCGSVRFEARGELRPVIYCHCESCRRQSGHFFACTSVPHDRLTVHDDAGTLTWFSATPAAERGFCRTCGSVLFWKPAEGARISIEAGCFDEPSGLVASHHIFLGEKGSYYEITDGLPQFAGDDE